MTNILIGAIIGVLIGGALVFVVWNLFLGKTYKRTLAEADKAGNVLKEQKLLEAKERMQSDLDRQANQRNQKIQQNEQRIKQQQQQLQQKQSELDRRISDNDNTRQNLQKQLELVDQRRKEVEQQKLEGRQMLEQIAGLSADEAKHKLIESLKDEAQSEAASYINEIMDEARMTANKEAKSIVIKTIQRVASETAVENAVTVFHIDSDEVKGRIIGREGRNIRALEAATGVEIVVDDTPEAIVLSCFDPVRRETARLALHQLVLDGRIHPARIEEVVAKVRKQL